ncbi:preprotein translocase subunit SecG [Candidatus Pacearchaeota archaeon]|nr:preprotein translocase subunit SecG [Candidatus Pacearchaeota archaeon]
MEKLLLITQVIISILLSVAVLVQSKDEGFTASGNQGFQATRRGPEKILFRATVILAALFLINAFSFVLI